jgi:penicillin amidase
MLASLPAPIIAEASTHELQRLLLEPRLGPAPAKITRGEQLATLSWKTYSWEMSSVWLESVVLHRPKRWLPEKYPNYDELLAAAVEAAVNRPDAPGDLSRWRWGSWNAVDIEHPVLGKIPLLSYWAGPGLNQQSGSRYTVKAVTPTHGPSERYTANLADWDQSTLNTVTGQSGNFLSPNYMDQWKAWYEGTTFMLPFSAQAVEAAKHHRLILQPQQ